MTQLSKFQLMKKKKKKKKKSNKQRIAEIKERRNNLIKQKSLHILTSFYIIEPLLVYKPDLEET